MEYFINNENLSSIVFDDKKNELSINWNTGGQEGAVCGLVFKVELVKKKKSTYKAPKIDYDPDYDNPF